MKNLERGNLAEQSGNILEAYKFYKLSAEEGNSIAQYKLGEYFAFGFAHIDEISKDESKSALWYEKSAMQGLKEAQYKIGLYYQKGIGVTKNYEKAYFWFRKSAEQDYMHAQYEVGECFANGQGVEENIQEAVDWYVRASSLGHAWAKNQLAMYKIGNSSEDSTLEEAFELLVEAVASENAQIQYNLAGCYLKGIGTDANYGEACYLFDLSAQQGNMYAQYELAMCFMLAKGVEKDEEEALHYLEKSATQGFATAQFKLGEWYYYGIIVDENFDEALRWLNLAKDQGYYKAFKKVDFLEEELKRQFGSEFEEEPEKEVILENLEEQTFSYETTTDNELKKLADDGDAMAQGVFGVRLQQKGDYADALYYLNLGAEQENEVAYFGLAVAYQHGLGVKRVIRTAHGWYKKSVEKGYVKACHNLGIFYLQNNCANTQNKGFELLNLALANKEATTYIEIAWCYKLGKGTGQDYRKYVDYLTIAAKKDCPKAQFELANYYRDEDNKEEALKWYLRLTPSENNEEYMNYIISQYEIGKILEFDFNTIIKTENPLPYYQNAADEGYFKAQYRLAKWKINTDHMPFPAEIKSLFLNSALQGYAPAQNALAEYCKANNLADNKEVFGWYKKSSEQNYAPALMNLGLCYKFGLGIEESSTTAFLYLSKSAELLETAKSCYNLAICYEEGYGTIQNISLAKDWYQKAVALGNISAKSKLTSLLEKNY
ncbi:MAG: hypothetical protein ATN36_06185 [Epulopiscium sp. Nele67-Bin005]|nr:MAG: hypothetical protein ATN36_06185 [Epulopiscium sp. Nele67-Bin005]